MSKNDRDNVIYIYTDGACSGNPGPGGYAALIIDGIRKKKLVDIILRRPTTGWK